MKKNRPDAIKKLRKIIPELIEHPRTGIGKPEMLMGNLKGKWSRRLNDKDRIVYEIKENEILVIVLSAKDHYDDK